eukprot:548322-Rhodomonas_salina.4
MNAECGMRGSAYKPQDLNTKPQTCTLSTVSQTLTPKPSDGGCDTGHCGLQQLNAECVGGLWMRP